MGSPTTAPYIHKHQAKVVIGEFEHIFFLNQYINPRSRIVKPKSQRPLSDNNLNPNIAKVSKTAESTADIIDELFHYEGQEEHNEQPGAGNGRERLNGTTESPNLMDNHNAYDYGSEVFSSGQESFDTQWAAINEIHGDEIHEGDKGFTTSDEGIM